MNIPNFLVRSGRLCLEHIFFILRHNFRLAVLQDEFDCFPDKANSAEDE